jgi:hypothetical protein
MHLLKGQSIAVLINMFFYSNQYYFMLIHMLKEYLTKTNDLTFYDSMLNSIEEYKKGYIVNKIN